MLEKAIGKQSELGLMFLRIIVGIVFLIHGGQKLFGLFGGAGMSETIKFFSSQGIYAPSIMGWFVALTEFFGGLALLAGFLTREFSILFIIIMIGAIVTIHGSNGFSATNQGYEYNCVLIGASLCLLFGGGGAGSMDRFLFPKDKWTFVDVSQIKLEPPSDD